MTWPRGKIHHAINGKIPRFLWENPTISMGKSTISTGKIPRFLWENPLFRLDHGFNSFFVSLPEAKSQSLMLTMEFPIFPGEVNV